MKKIVLFTVMLAFIAGTSVAVSSFYQSDLNTTVENTISNDGDKDKKADKKEDKNAKEGKAKAKDCSAKESCCKKGSKSCAPKDNQKKKEKE